MPSIQDRMKEVGTALAAFMNYEPQILGLIKDYNKAKLEMLDYEQYMVALKESKTFDKVDFKKIDFKKVDVSKFDVVLEKFEEAKLAKKNIKQTIKAAIASYDQKRSLVGPLLDNFTNELKSDALDGCDDGQQKIAGHLYIQRVRKALNNLGNGEYFARFR
jgi:hypothetical protein